MAPLWFSWCRSGRLTGQQHREWHTTSFVKGTESGKHSFRNLSHSTHVKPCASVLVLVALVNIYLLHAWTVSVSLFAWLRIWVNRWVCVCVCGVCSVSSRQTRERGGETGRNNAVCWDTPLPRNPVWGQERIHFVSAETGRRGASKGDGLQQPIRRLPEPRLIYRFHRANQQPGVL